MFVIITSALSVMIFIMGFVFCLVRWISRDSINDFNRGRRNYEVRFNPMNHKYYITNSTNYGDLDVSRFGIFRVHYKSKIDADLVMQRLNGQ